jgi:hypothetical protein
MHFAMQLGSQHDVLAEMGPLPSRAYAEGSVPVVLRSEVVGVYRAHYSATTM